MQPSREEGAAKPRAGGARPRQHADRPAKQEQEREPRADADEQPSHPHPRHAGGSRPRRGGAAGQTGPAGGGAGTGTRGGERGTQGPKGTSRSGPRRENRRPGDRQSPAGGLSARTIIDRPASVSHPSRGVATSLRQSARFRPWDRCTARKGKGRHCTGQGSGGQRAVALAPDHKTPAVPEIRITPQATPVGGARE